MKKRISLLVATTFLLSAGAQATTKQSASSATQSVTFQFAASDITTTSATISVVPSSSTQQYFWDQVTEERYNQVMAGAYASLEVNNMVDYANYLAVHNTYGLSASTYYSYVLSTGNDSYTWTDLSPETTYVVYAVKLGLDLMAVDTASIFRFTTAAEPVVVTDTANVHFALYYRSDGTGGWKDNIAEHGWWQYQGISADSLYITLSNGPLVSQLAGIYTIEDMDPDYTGLEINCEGSLIRFESITVAVTELSGNIIIQAEGVAKNGIFYIMTFDPIPVVSTSLGSTDSDMQSTKRIENGQLVIIRNGIRYNALGVRL